MHAESLSRMLIALALCLCPPPRALQAAEQADARQKFREEVMTFLKDEGFSPSMDEEDNRINFKKEDIHYWIFISEESPFFVTTGRAGFSLQGSDTLDRSRAMEACNEVNKTKKAVKMYCLEQWVALNIEQFIHSAEEFKYVFYSNLRVLANAYGFFVEKYNNAQNER
ncbi:MAG: YbjN domain-containing protein [Tannerella sp.]|nr:YbjN domain-containing protein [Tannerella sp.]